MDLGTLMEIVKQFQDDEFFERHYNRKFHPNGYWKWGLSKSGELYVSCNVFGDDRVPNKVEWIVYHNMPLDDFLTLKDMIRIVKVFGPLMVWL